jgi:hypothetical protein
MLSRPARDVISTIKTQLEIEPRWLFARPDGFEWWPGRLAQRIWVEDGDSPRVHIESDFLGDVPETDRTLGLVAIGNQFVTFSALVFHDNQVRLHASFSVTDENAGTLAWFASLVANAFNVAEACGPSVPGAHQLGAWCWHNSSLVFATFVPSVLFERSLFEALIYDSACRAIWARDIISACLK